MYVLSSDFVTVTFRVPQGTVLEPLTFLLYIYINEISKGLTPNIKFYCFADDYIMYRTVLFTEGSSHPQKDLDRVFYCTKCWQMQFNMS